MTAPSPDRFADLPRVLAVAPLSSGPDHAALTLDSGEVLTLTGGTRASLTPLESPDELAFLAYQWGRPDARALAVPAALYADLLPYFHTPGGQP